MNKVAKYFTFFLLFLITEKSESLQDSNYNSTEIQALLDYKTGLIFFKDESIQICFVGRFSNVFEASDWNIPSENGKFSLQMPGHLPASSTGMLFCEGMYIVAIGKESPQFVMKNGQRKGDFGRVRRKRQSYGHYRTNNGPNAYGRSNWNSPNNVPGLGGGPSQAQVQGQVFGTGMFSGQAQSQNGGMSQSQVQLSGVGIRGQIASSSGNAQAQLSLGNGAGSGQASGLGEGPSNSQVQVTLGQTANEESMASASATSGGATAGVGGFPLGQGAASGAAGYYHPSQTLFPSGSGITRQNGFIPGNNYFQDTSRDHFGSQYDQGNQPGEIGGHRGGESYRANVERFPQNIPTVQNLREAGSIIDRGHPGIDGQHVQQLYHGAQNGQGAQTYPGSLPATSFGINGGGGTIRNGHSSRTTVSPTGIIGRHPTNGHGIDRQTPSRHSGFSYPNIPGTNGIEAANLGRDDGSYQPTSISRTNGAESGDGRIQEPISGLFGGPQRPISSTFSTDQTYRNGYRTTNGAGQIYRNGYSTTSTGNGQRQPFAQSHTPGAYAVSHGIGQAQAQTVYFGSGTGSGGQYVPQRYLQDSQPGPGTSTINGVTRHQDQHVGIGTASQRQPTGVVIPPPLSQNGYHRNIQQQPVPGSINLNQPQLQPTVIRNGFGSTTNNGLHSNGQRGIGGHSATVSSPARSQIVSQGENGRQIPAQVSYNQPEISHGHISSSGTPSLSRQSNGRSPQITPTIYLPSQQNGQRAATVTPGISQNGQQNYLPTSQTTHQHQTPAGGNVRSGQAYRINGLGQVIPAGHGRHTSALLPTTTTITESGGGSSQDISTSSSSGQSGFFPAYGVSRSSPEDPDGKKCTIITFSCTIVIESNGRAKICRPNAVRVNGSGNNGGGGGAPGINGSQLCCC